MAPKKRAGGGKKSFMKGVARADEAEVPLEDVLQPVDSVATAEHVTGDAVQHIPSPGPAHTPAAAVIRHEPAAEGGPAASAEPATSGSETRGQMLQRHKKVCHR